MSRKRSIGELLLEAHLVDEAQLAIALETQKRTGRKLGSLLVELRFVDENVLAAFLSKQIDVPCVSLLNVEVPPSLKRRIPAHLAHRFGAVPIGLDGNAIEVAMIDPTDIDAVVSLEEASGLRVDPLIAPESSIRKVLQKIYPLDEEGLPQDFPDPSPEEAALFPDLVKEMEEGSSKVGQRLDAIERELRRLADAVERLTQEVGPKSGSPKLGAGDEVRDGSPVVPEQSR